MKKIRIEDQLFPARERIRFSFAYNLTIKHVNRPKFMCFFCARKSIVKPSGKNLSLINYY